MVRVGLAAPRIGGRAVLDRRLVSLSWEQLHDDRALALLFDPTDATDRWPEYLVAVSNAVMRLGHPFARVALVWRNGPARTLGWARRARAAGGPGLLAFPVLSDPRGAIAAQYGLPPDAPVWGQFLIDPAGVVREASVSAFPLRPGVEGLLRALQAVAYNVNLPVE